MRFIRAKGQAGNLATFAYKDLFAPDLGGLFTSTMPRLTRINARIRFTPIPSPRIRAPLKNTPKTGVKNEKAWSKDTG